MLNPEILKLEVQTFINSHLKSDITKLILKGNPFNHIDTQELIEQIEAKKKCIKKLPSWFNSERIYYPNKLNIEQTSSEETAKFKSGIVKGKNLIDLTGGLGVDCFYFAKKMNHITHCEINIKLSETAEHNSKILGVENIEYIQQNGLIFLEKTSQKFDWLYVDPSRRSDLKGKVFLLKDCLPNIPENLDLLLNKCNNILIKNSPLIDITHCINSLNDIKNIYIIALENEVKELLIHIEKGYKEHILIKTINLGKTIHQEFSFTHNKNYEVNFSEPLVYLYEPNSAILKSGGFNAIADAYGIDKLHTHSHLYTSEELIKDFPGRNFKITAIIPYNKKLLLKLLPDKKANITIRNFKENVNAIRKKTGIKDGGENYLFFTTNQEGKQIVIICKKLAEIIR